MKLTLLLALALHAVGAAAGPFVGATLQDGQNRLLVQRASGQTAEAPRMSDQVGFDAPRVSTDGRYVGWTALYPNCCTSYPIPLALIILSTENRLHRIVGGQSIFSWCFVPSKNAVASRHGPLHGPNDETFELRRITDGVLLRSYTPHWNHRTNQPGNGKLPEWATCAAS